MSTNYTAHAIIGVKVGAEKLYRVERRRVCSHPLPDDASYCPTCGKPAHELIAEPRYDERHDRLDTLAVVFSAERDYAIVGLFHCAMRDYGDPGFLPLPTDLSGEVASIIRILTAHDMYSGEDVGLYSMLDWG